MSNPFDPLAAFRRPGQTISPASQKETADKQPYHACQFSQDEQRYLEFRFKFPDPAECLSNYAIVVIQPEWRMGQGITLQYSTPMVVEIKGKNLIELYKTMKSWKVEWLAEFDPQEHLEPTDPTAPFIESIVFHTHKPEAAPPIDQRH